MTIINAHNLPSGSGGALPEGAGKKEEENPFMKKVQQAAEAKLAATVMGETMNPSSGGETLATQIVKSAMDNSADLVKRANEMADRKDTLAQQARDAADKSQKDLFTVMFSEMGRVSSDLRASIEKIDKDKPPPRDAIATIKEAKDLLTLLSGEDFGHRQAAQPPAQDSTLSLQLEQMRQNHELAMKKFESEMKEADRKFQLQMAQFQEDNKWKRQEYEDKVRNRGQVTDNLMDIGESILAGVRKDGNVGHEAIRGSASQDEPELNVMARSFPCQFCHTPIAIPNVGDEATCPNDECGAKFTIKKG